MNKLVNLIATAFTIVVLSSCSGLAKSQELCPNRVSTLVTIPGQVDSMVREQRVEIRQCPLDVKHRIGSYQLVAWEKDARTPSLILDAEDTGLYQLGMIEGVYVVEIMGGKASRVVVITFENGHPRVALDASSLFEPEVTLRRSEVVVFLPGETPEEGRRFSFPRVRSGAPRG